MDSRWAGITEASADDQWLSTRGRISGRGEAFPDMAIPRRYPVLLGHGTQLDALLGEDWHVSPDELPPLALVIDDDACRDTIEQSLHRVEGMVRRGDVSQLYVAMPLVQDLVNDAAWARILALPCPVTLVEMKHSSKLASVPRESGWRPAVKDSMDRIAAAAGIVFLLPLLLAIAIAIRLTSPGPALFVQPRLGHHNRIIPVFKFRTMYRDRSDPLGGRRTTRNDPRVTPIGAFLRRWSLDELPQLVNVLRGEMSIIGPRPHAVVMRAGEAYYFDALPRYLSRHRMKPGLTGWAQVNGHCGEIASIAAGRVRLEHDLHYVENWSLGLDLRIFFRTLGMFFSRRGRY